MVSHIRNQHHNSIKCRSCGDYLTQYLRDNNQNLCNKCSTKFFDRHGRHYNVNMDEYFV
jgi:hypothetical protein